jgi:putative transposase
MKKIKEATFRPELIDQLIKEYKGPYDFCILMRDLNKAVVDRAMEGEMEYHLGYPKHNRAAGEDRRNGHYAKSIETESGPVEIKVPRDRDGDFEPKIVKKGQRRLEGFNEKILSMYARGMSMRDIQGHLEEMYGTEVSPELISTVTEQVSEEVKLWQNRPLDNIYTIVYLDALVVKIKENNQIVNKSVYVAVGVNIEGMKEVLGLWISKTEGAKLWLSVVTELKNRGVENIYIACVDGLNGFEEAIHSVFPKATVQLCVVHMIRNSLKYVSHKDRKAVAADLKPIYTASTVAVAEEALMTFGQKWDGKYPKIFQTWSQRWAGIIPFLAFPKEIRKVIYTTNVIESINSQIRKIIRSKGSFPNDEAAIKLIYLALQNAQKKWTMPIHEWKDALNQFAIMCDDHF